MAFNRNSITSRKWRTKEVPVEGDETYIVRALSDAEVKAIQDAADKAGKGTFTPILLAYSLVDEHDAQIFKPEEYELVQASIPFGSMEPLWQAVAELNGLKVKTVAQEGTDLKNSPATPA